jgi:tRNA (cmo5U34)-methyltransferase
MTDSAISMFEQHAPDYLAARRRLVPSFDQFYGTAVEALELIGHPPARVLDLGAGTGLFASAVAEAHPGAELVLLDGSPAMLEQARELLGERASYITGRLEAPLPSGPWDAVVSALAIHHLDDSGKRGLYRRVHDEISAGGVFVNAEHVSAPTPSLEDAYKAWHVRRARELGASEAEWEGARERMLADRRATVEDQLEWLAEAGFSDVDCLFKDHSHAVLVARRAAS